MKSGIPITSIKTSAKKKPVVGLFVTCLVDLYRPSIGFATLELLQQAGCEVVIPESQTCCGQPAYNSGDRKTTQQLAKKFINEFEQFDYIVAPSGSCIAMTHEYYLLFDSSSNWFNRAQSLKQKSYEITSFLVDVIDFKSIRSSFEETITYHDSCSGLRSLKIQQQPRALLSQVKNIQINEMEDAEVCCGFGGSFCVKYSDISNKMLTNKLASITKTNASTLVGGDLGCLLNMVGKLKREGKQIQARHVVELLVENLSSVALAEPVSDEN